MTELLIAVATTGCLAGYAVCALIERRKQQQAQRLFGEIAETWCPHHGNHDEQIARAVLAAKAPDPDSTSCRWVEFRPPPPDQFAREEMS